MVPYLARLRRRERQGRAAMEEARTSGLHEPLTLHPIIDLDRCIGSANCVDVCPEGDVLRIQAGHALAVAPALCIGHGLCERSCPTDAIRLVFGTASRGVDLPRVRENFESNVPGLYIIGELGGMGLIRNAFEQGGQCMKGIAETVSGSRGRHVDVAIVGCGPAGLSASLHARQHGLTIETFEREDIGGAVRHFPRKKLVMTAPLDVPGFGTLRHRVLLKEDLTAIWTQIVDETGLTVRTHEAVESIVSRADGGFELHTKRGTYRAQRVVLAIGRRGNPRRLGVPGEDLAKVAYALLEPEAFQGDRVLVVGGGDSAVEAALALAEQPNTDVTVSYRGERFARVRPKNRERIDRAIRDRRITVLWSSKPIAIEESAIRYADAAATEHVLPNDRVFIFAGGELPTEFLKSCGVAIDTKFGT